MSQLTGDSTVVAASSPPGDRAAGLRVNWLYVGVTAALVVAIFWSSLWRLWSKTNPFYGEGNWGHSILVPLIGLYYLYLNREELARRPIVPNLPTTFSRFRWVSGLALLLAGGAGSWAAPVLFPGELGAYLTKAAQGMLGLGALVLLLNWGLGTLLFGLLTFGYGIWPGQNDYVKDLGLVITIFGIVLTMCGWPVMKIAWFPILFLICALPWPGLVYSRIATPLQHLASSVAVFVLQLTGVDASQAGTKILMDFGPLKPPRMLNVAEACAGLRSLMTFITLGAAIGFLSSRPLWQKIVITLSAIPIAVLCNVMRVSGQGLLDVYVSQEMAEGVAHQYFGLLMLIPALFMLMGVGWLLDRIFVEEVDAASLAVVKRRAASAPMRRTVSGAGASGADNGRAGVGSGNGQASAGTGGPRRPNLES